MEQVTTMAGVNTRVPHLERETIFGSTKRKLNLPLGGDGNSHRHDRVNFVVPRFDKRMLPVEARSVVCARNSLHQPCPLGKTSKAISLWRSHSRSPKKRGSPIWPIILSKSGQQIS